MFKYNKYLEEVHKSKFIAKKTFYFRINLDINLFLEKQNNVNKLFVSFKKKRLKEKNMIGTLKRKHW